MTRQLDLFSSKSPASSMAGDHRSLGERGIGFSPVPVPEVTQVAGVDEVGRGCLFGPVVAAAVILSEEARSHLQKEGVTDSKQLSARQRERLEVLIQSRALACQIGVASVAEIDRLNILQAALLAMRRAIVKLQPQPQVCWVDGNRRIPDLGLPQETWVKGDQRSIDIAAASIVAKVWRDRVIDRLAERYPGYDLVRNKGYGSARHRQALLDLGLTPQHRRSFSPCRAIAASIGEG